MAEILQGDVKVPVIGKTKKAWIMIPAGLAGVYVVWRWYGASRSEGSEPTEEDLGYYSSDLSDMGLSTTGGPYNPSGNNGSTSTDGTAPGAIDSNAEWTQESVERLTNAGYDGAVVYAALGEFLGRRALDKSEATIARAALAAAGQPPENRPWSVIEEATTGGTGTPKAPTGLRAGAAPTTTSIRLTWDKVDGANGYRIYRGVGENIGHSMDTGFTVEGLQPDTSYSFTVAALSSTGKVGPRSNTYKGKTTPVKLVKPSGLKASAVTKSSFRVSCTTVKGAQYYRWYVNGRASGASDQPYRDFTGLKSKTSYKVSVAADTTNQSPGPESSPITVKTK